jgi:divalent metal cation (Fe/Co/Zn/Cd) transporter
MENNKSKEITLRAAWLLSSWAPITTWIAYIMGGSITLLADFLRRTLELAVLFSNWLIFKKIIMGGKDIKYKNKYEKIASVSVSIIMIISFSFIFYSALKRINSPSELKNIWVGLVVAVMGFIVNGWFWFRNRNLTKKDFSKLFYAQWHLYRSKTLIDLSVVIILLLSKTIGKYSNSYLIDPLGSIVIAFFLLYSAIKILKMNFLKKTSA